MGTVDRELQAENFGNCQSLGQGGGNCGFVVFFSFFFSFLILIFCFGERASTRGGERGRGGDRERLSSRLHAQLSAEPDVGLDPDTPGS